MMEFNPLEPDQSPFDLQLPTSHQTFRPQGLVPALEGQILVAN